jgi:hypothetical protein
MTFIVAACENKEPEMKLTVTGANGFIGRRVVELAVAAGHSVHLMLRQPRPGAVPAGCTYSLWNALENEPSQQGIEGADAVIHLAGESVAQRWTEDVKKRILRSRQIGTQRLVQAISVARERPRVLVSASAIGYYGSRGDEALTESSPAGGDFLAGTCEEWEKSAELAAALGLRVARVRIGIALGRGGGALDKMILPFKLGLGGRIGSGEQWMSWIHVEDLARLLLACAADERFRGAVNGVAPHALRNSGFTQALALTLRRPALFPVPEWVLWMLYGEMARALTASQRVLPEVALTNGFAFQFPEVGPALRDLLGPGKPH